jgi:hypothetical protein
VVERQKAFVMVTFRKCDIPIRRHPLPRLHRTVAPRLHTQTSEEMGATTRHQYTNLWNEIRRRPVLMGVLPSYPTKTKTITIAHFSSTRRSAHATQTFSQSISFQTIRAEYQRFRGGRPSDCQCALCSPLEH